MLRAKSRWVIANRRAIFRVTARVAGAGALAGSVVLVSRGLPHVNVTTLTLVLVLVVVAIALHWGRLEAVVAALVASLSLDYYVLPPQGFGIASPDQWLALATFVTTALGIALTRNHARAKEMEAEITRRSDELKSAVFSALAHDARGPLGTIQVAASTLSSDRPGSPAQQRELVAIILEEVGRMNRWIDEACKVSDVKPAQFTSHKAPHLVKDLVLGALDEFRPRLAGRPVGIGIPDGLPMVECDGEMIRHVLKLLLDNAVKYTPRGSPLAIACGEGAAGLVVSVCDAGPGIPEQEKWRIFQKHYRGSDQGSAVPGTGMGLASAKQIVESQGGEIWVTRSPQGGAAFYFTLPAAVPMTV